MPAQILALLTAAAWGIGGFFEKRGLLLGNLPAHVGITLRTATALLVLAAISVPQWRALATAGSKSLLYVILGGGVLAGAVGMLCFYAALRAGSLSQVMPIAFTSPLFGVLLAVILGTETLQPRTAIGMLLTVGGIVLLSIR
jgi:transporter family protein